MNQIFVPFTINRNHNLWFGSAVLTHVSLPKLLIYALSHTSYIMTTRAKNWILKPCLFSARWIEEESTILVTDTFCVLTSAIIIYPECASVALVTKNAKRMRPILLSSVVCPVVQYLPTLSHKRHDLKKKIKLPNVKYASWFSLQLLSETFLNLRRIQRVAVINIRRSVKYPLYLSRFNETLIYSTIFRKIFVQLKQNRSMRTDGPSDRHDEANGRSSQFGERT